MTFWQQMLASLIGAFFGFGFAIIGYVVTSEYRDHREQKIAGKQLRRELEYDISYLGTLIEQIDKFLRAVVSNNHSIYMYLRYVFFQRTFIQGAFHRGVLYKKLKDNEISKLNEILMHLDYGLEKQANDYIVKWQNNGVDQADASRYFEFEKDQLQDYGKTLKEFLNRLTV